MRVKDGGAPHLRGVAFPTEEDITRRVAPPGYRKGQLPEPKRIYTLTAIVCSFETEHAIGCMGHLVAQTTACAGGVPRTSSFAFQIIPNAAPGNERECCAAHQFPPL